MPEVKLILGLIKTLIVVQEVSTVRGTPTLPVTFAVQLIPLMAKDRKGRNSEANQKQARQSFLGISSAYRPILPILEETWQELKPYDLDMRQIALALLLLTAGSGLAQMKFTAEQLLQFVKSSIRLKHRDDQVANYLKKVTLTEQLPGGQIEELLASGMGPKTYDQLRLMVESSAKLPAPKPSSRPADQPVAALIPPPTEAERRKLISELREYALNYDKALPDFLCTQVTRRFYDPAGLEYWVAADTITAKLSYFQRKEEKKILFVNNQYKDIDWDKVGGATSTGEFGDMLREIFEKQSETSFQWERWGTLRKHRTHVIRYQVPQSRSRWAIVYEKAMSVTPGYTGLIYADAQTGMILRVTLEALDLPASFPIQVAKNMLDYDYTEIAGSTFLLPLRAEVRMREGRLLIRNDIEFRNYRKFGADTSISFDTPEALDSEMLKEGVVTRDIPKEEGSKPNKP